MGLWKGYHCRATAGLWEVVQRKGRWREIHGVGLFLGMPELLPASRDPGEQQRSQRSPAAGQRRQSLAGKGVCWEGSRMAIAGAAAGAGTGRERQQSLGDASQPEQTRSHRCPRSPAVPPSSCKSLSRHQYSHSFLEVASLAPGSSRVSTRHSGYLYIQGAR